MRSCAQAHTVGIPGYASARGQVTLRNGVFIRLRPIRPDDAPRLIALCRRLSPRTIYQRFFTVRRMSPEEAHTLATVDYRDRMAVVAVRDSRQGRELVGVARYGVAGEDLTPDVGLVVEDAWQGFGLGPILLNVLVRTGEARGFSKFQADVLAENRRALRLLARNTDIIQRTVSDGVTSVVFRGRADSSGEATR